MTFNTYLDLICMGSSYAHSLLKHPPPPQSFVQVFNNNSKIQTLMETKMNDNSLIHSQILKNRMLLHQTRKCLLTLLNQSKTQNQRKVKKRAKILQVIVVEAIKVFESCFQGSAISFLYHDQQGLDNSQQTGSTITFFF